MTRWRDFDFRSDKKI